MVPRRIGRYRVYDAIASGGMAVVHLGRLAGAAGFSRTVAIKRLHPHLATDPEVVTMLLDEARLASRIRHPNVAPILDVVVERGDVCLVLEYVAGESLAQLLTKATKRAEAAPVPVTLAIISDLLRGLAAAHDATADDGTPLLLVHRDVSPQNVLVGADGVVRVIDFGVAKATARLQTTQDGQLKGKFAYMAPEQLKSAPVDARTDLYAAGIVFWEALAGRRLFEERALTDLLVRTAGKTIDPPSRYVAGVSPALDRIVLCALSGNPDARFPSATAMLQAIAESGPVATPDEVAAWVQRVAGEDLSRRRALVASIESGALVDDTPTPSAEAPTSVGAAGRVGPPPTEEVLTTVDGFAGAVHAFPSASTPPRRRLGVRGILLLVAAGGALSVAFFSGARFSRGGAALRSTAPAAASFEAPPSESSSAPPPTAVVEVDPPPAAVSTTQTPASSERPPLAGARVRPNPRRSPPAARSSQPPSYCSQRKLAFTVGPDGIERPRPECL